MSDAWTLGSRRSFWVLGIFLALLLLAGLGSRGLNEPDEGRYANIALNMLAPGQDWLEPALSGHGHYDKPPLLYWTTALCFKMFGRNECAARLPSVLGAVLTLVGIGWAAWRLHGPCVAWWAMLVTATLMQFWLLARFLTPDMFFTGWVTLAIAAWAESRQRNGAWQWWLLSLFFWILAWYVKATPLFIPLAGLAAGIWITRDKSGWQALRLPWLLLGILLLGSPWFLLMMHRHPDLVDFFLHREIVGRMAGHVDGRRGPWFYYLALAFVAWLPWWPVVMVQARKKNLLHRAALKRWMRGGFEFWILAVGLLIFSSISSKLPTYTLVLTPWVGLAFARILAAPRPGESTPPRFPMSAGCALGAGLVMMSLIIALAPRVESQLGANSSVRTAAHNLQVNGAQVIYADRFLPGLEFYFGQNVVYVMEPRIRQLTSEPPSPHFLPPEKLHELLNHPPANSWALHYRPVKSGVLAPAALHLPSMRVGDFDLICLNTESSKAKFRSP